MILNIINHRNQLLTCSEHPVVSLLKYINRYDNICLCNSLNFQRVNFTEYKGSECDKELNWLFDCIYSLYGVKVITNKIPDIQNTKELIVDQLLQGMPVLIFINAYWCPWVMAYKKGKLTPHYVLIVGYNSEGYLCLDMMIDSCECLPYYDFDAGAKEIFIFEVLEKPTVLLQDKVKFLSQSLYRVSVKSNNMFNNILRFSEEIASTFDINNEIHGYEPYKYAPIFTWLKAVCTARLKYGIVLKDIGEAYYTDVFQTQINQLNRLSNEWKHIIIMLFKAVYSNNKKRIYNNIAERLKDLSDIEKKTFYEINCNYNMLLNY